MLAAILGLRYAVGIESRCLNYIGTRSKIAGVYLTYHIGACEHKDIVVALQQPVVASKQGATEIILAQPIALHHSTHGTIEHQYPVF